MRTRALLMLTLILGWTVIATANTYRRTYAVQYALDWGGANRNTEYYCDFTNLDGGGFLSQILNAGCMGWCGLYDASCVDEELDPAVNGCGNCTPARPRNSVQLAYWAAVALDNSECWGEAASGPIYGWYFWWVEQGVGLAPGDVIWINSYNQFTDHLYDQILFVTTQGDNTSAQVCSHNPNVLSMTLDDWYETYHNTPFPAQSFTIYRSTCSGASLSDVVPRMNGKKGGDK